ncbi:MAG: arginine biosynthesis bifunctional protein ArgJ [Candidatus Binatia bacterium]|nr:MAG: arginine biosynthesis bifunctional protein ArgJ [Candidatus Binatia bacterium]
MRRRSRERLPSLPLGYRFAGVSCGLKKRRGKDLALVFSDLPARVAGALTTNVVRAAPVEIAAERLRSGEARAILANSGNANAFTGAEGLRVARRLCAEAARVLGVPENAVLPCSTGPIGAPLPFAPLRKGILRAAARLSPEGFFDALEAMRTTDAFPKWSSRTLRADGRTVVVTGMAKGAGMIAPRMRTVGPGHATMLAFVLTDAALSASSLRSILREALPVSFGAIVVDGDTSTNDTVLLLANGASLPFPLRPRSRDYVRVAEAVTEVMVDLARMIVRDGEGATRVVDVVVRGARTKSDAEKVAEAIARSPLCKTAFFAGDPYVGRFVCAAGYSGARFDPSKLRVFVGPVCVAREGRPCGSARDLARARAIAARAEFVLTLDLGAGSAEARRTTSDLTPAYVRLNSAYRS